MTYYERNLPHWLPEGKHLFLTWRLHSSLPLTVLQQRQKDTEPQKGKRFLHFDNELDGAACGPQWLRQPYIAMVVQSEILGVAQREWCVTHSWVVMPNHVHLVLEPKPELSRITQAIKGRSAIAVIHYWEDEDSHSVSRNPSITGCAAPPLLRKSARILNEIPSPPAWSKIPQSGLGPAPTSSIGFSLCAVPLAVLCQVEA
jgi:hypothetical protein